MGRWCRRRWRTRTNHSAGDIAGGDAADGGEEPARRNVAVWINRGGGDSRNNAAGHACAERRPRASVPFGDAVCAVPPADVNSPPATTSPLGSTAKALTAPSVPALRGIAHPVPPGNVVRFLIFGDGEESTRGDRVAVWKSDRRQDVVADAIAEVDQDEPFQTAALYRRPFRSGREVSPVKILPSGGTVTAVMARRGFRPLTPSPKFTHCAPFQSARPSDWDVGPHIQRRPVHRSERRQLHR